MRHALILIFSIFFIFSLPGCQKCDDPCDKRCDNYDPCCGLTADFKIFEMINVSALLEPHKYESDTVLRDNTIILEAQDQHADEYEWKIGSDPRIWTGRQVEISFSTTGTYTADIELTIRKKYDKKCLPQEKEEKKSMKKLTIVEWDQSRVLGKFEGYRNNIPNELLTVNIEFVSLDGGITPPNPRTHPRINNLTPGCEGYAALASQGTGYKRIIFIAPNGNCCYHAHGLALINDQGDLEVEFKHFPFYPNNTYSNNCDWKVKDGYVTDHYYGKRIE